MQPQSFDLIIFGGTGDLSMRKLLPAMYRAFRQGDCDADSRILVCARKKQDIETLAESIQSALATHIEKQEYEQPLVDKFLSIIEPTLLDVVDPEKGWQAFAEKLAGREDKARVFYLAVMPSIFGVCCENLSKFNLVTPNARVVVEKPLGYDLASAEKINETIASYFQEKQIYRIDHYLGKETVQNLLALRFSNFLFENIWDAKSIDHIQISICEQVGLEGRAGFYDDAGAMRDMVQNHLLQLLCLVAMESPNRLEADEVRAEKIKVLRSLKPFPGQDTDKLTVRGQYVSGQVDGSQVKGYLDELGNCDSQTETYVAIKTYIENWRWAGVPFYLRTGKRLKSRSAEIIVQFKEVTHNIYASSGQPLKPNRLIIELQPDEKIRLELMANAIGSADVGLKPITLNIDFADSKSNAGPTAYQRLLLDAINGNSTLFIHREEVRAAWQWVDPIINHWRSSNVPPEPYSAGSWGPQKANELFDKPGQSWADLENY